MKIMQKMNYFFNLKKEKIFQVKREMKESQDY